MSKNEVTVVDETQDNTSVQERLTVLPQTEEERRIVRWGQPTKYKIEYSTGLIKYFQEKSERINKDGSVNPPPTLFGYAAEIEVDTDTLSNWSKKFPEFKKAMKVAKAIQANFITGNAMTNKSNAQFSALMMKNNHGWKDKSEQELTHKTSLESIIDESNDETN